MQENTCSRSLSLASLLAGMTFAVVGFLPSSGLAQAPAATNDAPTETTAIYGDWMLHCAAPSKAAQTEKGDRPTEAIAANCEIVQTIQARGNQATIAKLALGYLPQQDNGLTVTAVLPVDVTLPGGVGIVVYGKTNKEEVSAQTLAWRRCAGGACFAGAGVEPSLLKAAKQQKAGQIRFVNARGQLIGVPLSWNGFTAAFAALDKLHKAK
nr:invasion associated locus B family protein [uncultured Cohaesibacter sp.]